MKKKIKKRLVIIESKNKILNKLFYLLEVNSEGTLLLLLRESQDVRFCVLFVS